MPRSRWSRRGPARRIRPEDTGRSRRCPTSNRQPIAARLFHEQDWGGLIEAECRPTRRAYLDDRFELFGKEAILEYIDALTGGPAWDTVRDRERIDLVWVKPDRGLAKRLYQGPGVGCPLPGQGLGAVRQERYPGRPRWPSAGPRFVSPSGFHSRTEVSRAPM